MGLGVYFYYHHFYFHYLKIDLQKFALGRYLITHSIQYFNLK